MAELMELVDVEVHFDQASSVLAEIKNALWGTGRSVRALDGVNLRLDTDEVQGVIGESGCGKTTLLEVLLGLQDPTAGKFRYKGRPVGEFDKAERRAYHKDVQMIFQDPFNSLDPKYTVSETLGEQLEIHDMTGSERRKREILREVELSPPERYLDQYPDQLSGGEKQRVSIARALIVDPEVILADEPVSMLDVSTQASILRLLSEIVTESEVAMVYVSHDISTVSQVCDVINVMYLGRAIEVGPTEAILQDPKHPYTRSLIQAVPLPDPDRTRERVDLEGDVPDPLAVPSGCRFKDRCPERMPVCDHQPIDWDVSDDRRVACHLYYDHETATGGTPDEDPVASDD